MSRFPGWRSLVLVLVMVGRAEAGSVSLAWDPSPEPDVAGYTLAYGKASGQYTAWIDAGNATAFTIASLADGTYYFAVRAYTHTGQFSSYSNEVMVKLSTPSAPAKPSTPSTPSKPPAPAGPVAPTSSCTTADPFASMGGGTCYNGGWLPPGMAVPGGSSAPAPAPKPAPAPQPSAPKPSTGCTTADPFAGMGGGTCYNGGWLPPGMAAPGGSSAPAPAPNPAPAPKPSAPSTPQVCTTADPFASMGGGTCYNGGWLPPGMAAPGGGAAAPAPAPSPSPSPAPTPSPAPAPPVENTGCPGADPFTVLGGGTCYKGGWLPRGMNLTITGTLTVVDAEQQIWAIEEPDGTVYMSPTELSPLLLVDGATVTFHGLSLPSTSGSSVVNVEIIAFEVHQ